MVATPNPRLPALCEEERCAEDGVRGVEEREKGGQGEWGEGMRESVCVEWRGGDG